jgi:hypothetical protein
MAQIQALKRVEADRLKDAAIRKALAAEQASRRSKLEAAAASVAEQQRANDPINQAINETTVPLVTTPDDEDDIDAPVTVPKSVSGTAGGLTGRGGAGGRPGASPGVLGGDGWLCPVQGTGVFFSDTWGAPRSGGRVHLGILPTAVRATDPHDASGICRRGPQHAGRPEGAADASAA